MIRGRTQHGARLLTLTPTAAPLRPLFHYVDRSVQSPTRAARR
jgi:hypothetical protein